MIILIELLILVFLLYVIYILSYSMFKGAPYAALGKDRIKTMMKLLKIQKGKKLADLGAGDGRILKAAALNGALSYGYEINPLIFLISKIKLHDAKNTHPMLKDYWKENLTRYDYITVWGVPTMMSRLEKKLLIELKKGTLVASNHCKFPNWKYSKEENDVYLYIVK